MSKKNSFLCCCIILTAILLTKCLSFATANTMFDPNDHNTITKINAQKMIELERRITLSATQSFTLSLEKKENVDFLLTPALLMQEVLSDDMIITYPTE